MRTTDEKDDEKDLTRVVESQYAAPLATAGQNRLGPTDDEPVTAYVSPIHQGEDGTGPLESTDLYVAGRGISLLVNIPAGSRVTYSLFVDKAHRQTGSIPEVTAEGSVSVDAVAKGREVR